jgi:hypothetical protein
MNMQPETPNVAICSPSLRQQQIWNLKGSEDDVPRTTKSLGFWTLSIVRNPK